MQTDESYVIAIAEIDGEKKEFYREGKKEGFYMPKYYSSQDIKSLQLSITNNMHLIKPKIKKLGYFYSNDSALYSCKNDLPEVICSVLEKELSIRFFTCGQGDNFIIYTQEIDYRYARDRYNDHFNGNLW